MINQQERYYNILKLNKWFAISSILFAFIWLLAFANDFNRPWKKYQIEFRELEIEKTRADIVEANLSLESDKDYSVLNNQMESAQNEVESHQDEIEAIEREIQKLDAELYAKNQIYQFSKADLDVAKYNFEQAQHGHGDLESTTKSLNSLIALTDASKLAAEVIESKVEAENNKLKVIRQSLKEASDAVVAISRDKNLLDRKLKKIDPKEMSFSNKVANVVRDIPVLDFIDPYYEVKQVVIKDIEDDMIFMGVPKVDRCMTCHMGIDKKGFENAQQPYTTHPNMELYLGANSPHPMNEYGCTGCHAGRGRGTDFISSAHSPNTPEMAERWEKELGWHPLHHWETPMLPLKYVEASCLKCHASSIPIKDSPNLALGMTIVEKGGCFGCHQIDGFENVPKPGPGLRKINSKIKKDFAYKWIYEPRAFRENSWMPHFFKQINNGDSKSVKRTNQEVHAIVSYLFDRSELFKMDRLPNKGNAENGRVLVNSLGCLGCHTTEGEVRAEFQSVNTLRREHGPALIKLGSKTTQRWIYNWIRDPQKYYAETKMPNLRLSKQEAADISAYLISQRDKDFEQNPTPGVDEVELNVIVSELLSSTLRNDEVKARLGRMEIDEKLNYVGGKLIRQYGCFSCHDIDGFEGAKPIGTTLSTEGSKLITKLDFGYFHDKIPHTKWDWFDLKLDNPRIFDMIPLEDHTYKMKVKSPLDKLRMPHFGMNNQERDAIVTVIMGLVKDEIPPSKLPNRTQRNIALEAGQILVDQYNCKGCHPIDGDGGAIQPTIASWLSEIADDATAEDKSLVLSFSPPILDTEGQKVQPDWLFKFFKNPSMIRPNLQVRMPNFEMISDEDWNTIIKYFQLKDGQTIPYEAPHSIVKNSTGYKAGKVIQEMGACENCHFYGSQKPKQAALSWGPNLALVKERLRPDWLVDWFRDPQVIMPGTKMPAPYIPSDEPLASVKEAWGKNVAKLHSEPEKLLEALRDYTWGISGPTDVSKIVKAHIAAEGYGFVIEEEDDWGDEDW
ncbi:MAG: c-type cytochrome [Candidatus Marinimicrobia bacterium]|nr:c-type cytochrome [Candidatus Neomarinimicrobiota bacterium]MBL7010518.1 c-type cytochrome [Candidatus Neomarinimicrobiota bacterium]MBL7030861.1 c-type cytochrome [Candidatus Neomarinimicrobiota bacterium]